jgi:hypothetical protein
MDVYEGQDFDDCVDLKIVELVILVCSSPDNQQTPRRMKRLDYSLFMLGLLGFLLSLLGSVSASSVTLVSWGGKKKSEVKNLSCQESRGQSRV